MADLLPNAKPLEWDALYGYAGRARTPFGWCVILDISLDDSSLFSAETPWDAQRDEDWQYFGTLDEAKADVQADFDARIRATLTASPAGDDPKARPAAAFLTADEKRSQAERCACHGSDDYCPCQNAPDRQTIKARAALAPSLPGKEEGRG